MAYCTELSSESIMELEKLIKYKFKDKKLLSNALTHSSYANEHKKYDIKDNERLEFLGDAVLELISSKFLYDEYTTMPEGDMTKLRAALVCEPTLALDARTFMLGKYLLLGNGEDAAGGRYRDSVVSDALEALIGAIYIDGGIKSAEKFIREFILNDIENKKLFNDSKTHLQEIVQAKTEDVLSYEVVSEEGPAHDKVFTVEARLADTVIGTGRGRSKKSAEQNAAYEAIKLLR
ncbi:MAG: ribonuclease III [Eubacterium sp.]